MKRKDIVIHKSVAYRGDMTKKVMSQKETFRSKHSFGTQSPAPCSSGPVSGVQVQLPYIQRKTDLLMEPCLTFSV